MKFGENLRNLRKSKKITQEQLAEKVGVSRQSVSKWETGEAYPEMNNILILCDIFNCKINTLVNEGLLDINSLDEEIKMKVVKFKEKKQRKMKGISKAIYVVARILQIFVILGICLSLICMISIPFVLNKLNTSEKTLDVFGRNHNYEINNNKILINEYEINVDTITNLQEYIANHSNTYHIVSLELVTICMIATLVIIYMILKHIEKLFVNIHNENSPFTLENVKHIKRIALLLILEILLPDITGVIFEIITKVDMSVEFEVANILFGLIILSLAYIFEYGYEIQLDSKGRMYGDENE